MAGEITVTVHFDADAAYFSVSDTGVGIPSEDVPKLGERFYRVDVGILPSSFRTDSIDRISSVRFQES
jgi:signal transduction histidine kinase